MSESLKNDRLSFGTVDDSFSINFVTVNYPVYWTFKITLFPLVCYSIYGGLDTPYGSNNTKTAEEGSLP